MRYPCSLTQNGDDGFTARFRDVPEAITEGGSVNEALANAADALEVALLGRMKDGLDLPAPSAGKKGDHLVSVSAQAGAKLALYQAFRESGLSRVALAKKLGKDEAEVRRMLDPYHATRLTALDGAMRAMGRRLLVVAEAE